MYACHGPSHISFAEKTKLQLASELHILTTRFASARTSLVGSLHIAMCWDNVSIDFSARYISRTNDAFLRTVRQLLHTQSNNMDLFDPQARTTKIQEVVGLPR